MKILSKKECETGRKRQEAWKMLERPFQPMDCTSRRAGGFLYGNLTAEI